MCAGAGDPTKSSPAFFEAMVPERSSSVHVPFSGGGETSKPNKTMQTLSTSITLSAIIQSANWRETD